MPAPAEWLPLLSRIADEADAIALRLFRRSSLKVQTKDDGSPVSEADQAIETAARRLLASHHSSLGVLGEEEGETGGEDTRLILDPIDGTKNYVRGIPVFASLLAIEEHGAVTAGLISAPALGQRWHAARGQGAWNGTRRLQVSSVSDWSQAQVFHGSLAGSEARVMPPGLQILIARASRSRGFGDFWQHALVAEGAGEVAVDPRVAPWDIAALQVIVEEAGGRATTLGGERSIYGGSLVTSNGVLHGEALALLNSH